MGSPFMRFEPDGTFAYQGSWKSAPVGGYKLAKPNKAAAPRNVIAAAADTVVPGSLSGTEAFDLIGVELVAGQTYTFSYRGTATDGVEDPYLGLFDSTLNTVLAEDDDGGLGRGSQITFTATETATHYLYATSFYTLDSGDPSIDTGNYTIDIWSPDPAKDAPSTLTGAELIGPGTSFGYLDSGTDVDTYRIDAKAGQVYALGYAGGIASASELANPTAGENIGVVRVLDAAGKVVATGIDYESSVSFFAEQDATYYVQISPYDPALLGGYSLNLSEINPADYDPLDAIDWREAANVPFTNVKGTPTAYVYFAPAGENFGELGDDGETPLVTYGWQQFQIDGVMNALKEYEKILGTNYEITTDASKATFRLVTTESEEYGAYFYPRDPSYGTQQGIGAFNLLSGGFTIPESLQQGGYSYGVILHEFGHAHGLAHPHDNGGGSDVMLGVTGPDSLGVYDLNQGVYTVMSYNDGWETNPDGPQPFTRATVGYGWSGSLSAFDIAQLQERYGVHAAATGNDVYRLDDVNGTGTFYATIYDTGGTDLIRYDGAKDAHIDLLAATLDYTPTGGGVVSYVDDIHGGFTIANNVVIENAIGGAGNDTLLGNSANNVLTGNGGNDTLFGREGDDTLLGGAGDDTIRGGEGADTITGGAGNDTLYGDSGNDVFLVGTSAGLDTVVGGDGYDTIRATDKGTLLRWTSISEIEEVSAGGFAGVKIVGSNDADTFDFSTIKLTGIAAIEGSYGDDKIIGSAGDDIISGGVGADVLTGGAGDDTIRGGEGADTITGGVGNDTLYGDNGNDVFLLGTSAGLDTVVGGVGYDTIRATDNGTLFRWASISEIEEVSAGGFAGVKIVGSKDADTFDFSTIKLTGIAAIEGSNGDDRIIGSTGDDIIIGGVGADVLTGGAGRDTFVYENTVASRPGVSVDRITDFQEGTDKIDLSAIDADATLTGKQAFTFIGAGAFTGAKGELHYTYVGGDTRVSANLNGDLKPDFEIVLSGIHTLTSGDFLFA